jgi:hypothetical protein
MQGIKEKGISAEINIMKTTPQQLITGGNVNER